MNFFSASFYNIEKGKKAFNAIKLSCKNYSHIQIAEYGYNFRSLLPIMGILLESIFLQNLKSFPFVPFRTLLLKISIPFITKISILGKRVGNPR